MKATEQATTATDNAVTQEGSGEGSNPEQAPSISSPTAKTVPKSWADLVRSKAAAAPASSTPNGLASAQSLSTSKSASLADALKSFSVDSENKITFIEPRGLVNTGNMCYMNSVSALELGLLVCFANEVLRFCKF